MTRGGEQKQKFTRKRAGEEDRVHYHNLEDEAVEEEADGEEEGDEEGERREVGVGGVALRLPVDRPDAHRSSPAGSWAVGVEEEEKRILFCYSRREVLDGSVSGVAAGGDG